MIPGVGTIIGIATDLLGKIIAPLFGLLEKWGIHRAGRKQGQAEQRAADLEAGMKEARDANKARGSVGGSDSDVDRLLRPPGSRGGS